MKLTKQAFTLVELIVVITILAILGTIAFISLQGYSASSRDSVRISDVSNMKTSLELFHLDAGKYPIPDNAEKITYGTDILWYQGTLGETTVSQLSRNLNEIPTDPLTDKEYIFSTSGNRNEFEILNLLESDLVYSPHLTSPKGRGIATLISQTNAATSIRIPRVDGQYNGLFIKTANYIFPTPSLITAEPIIPLAGLVIDNTNITSQVITGGTNIPNIGNINSATGELDITLSVYSGTPITSKSSNADKILAMQAIQGAYTGSELASTDIYQLILNTAENDLPKLVDILVLGNTSISSEIVPTTTYILDTGIILNPNFIEDGNNYISSVQSQELLKTNWIKYQTMAKVMLPQIVIDNTSTSINLISSELLAQGDNIILSKFDNSFITGQLGTVTTTTTSLISSINPFGDGSLVAKYELENNSNDTLGNYNGTQNSITYDIGMFNQGAVFNGVSGTKIQSNVNFWGNSYKTLSFWIKAPPKLNCIPFSNFSGWGYIQAVTANNVLDVYSTSNVKTLTSGVVLDNTFHHIVVTWDVDGMKLYTDNVLVDSSVIVDGTNNEATIIGGFHDIGSYAIDGLLDQIEMYNRALTPTEVNILYTQGVTKYSSNITSYNLGEIPNKAFKGIIPTLSTSLVDTGLATNFSTNVLVSGIINGDDIDLTYGAIVKTGRDIVFKWVGETGMILKEISCNLWK